MGMIRAGDLDRRIRIERPVPQKGSPRGAGLGTWELVAEVWASVRDILPSRAERVGDGINIASRPARVRIRFRTGVDASMRFAMGDRIMRIVAGPAEIGRREGLEFMVEELNSAGGGS